MPPDELDLHPIIARNLQLMGYEPPRPIQAMSRLPILQGRDVIGLAKTGTGKTAAFIAPIAHHLISHKPVKKVGKRRETRMAIDPAARLRGLVLCPTRELAQQVADEAARVVQGSVLRVACAYGKVALRPQVDAIARGVDLLVATPGRVRELLDAGALSLEHVRHVAVDEADRMLDMGFLPQVRQILELIPARANAVGGMGAAPGGAGRQTLLFTSTMPQEIEELAGVFLHDPVRVEADRHTTPVEHVQQHLLPVDDVDKVPLLLHLIESRQWRGALVFCRTRRRVGWVGTALQRNNIPAGMLHGDMSQAKRKKSLDQFANRELRVLVATDVAARGLHIEAVKTVVNYDLPLTPEEYVHRIGRAAHGGGGAGEAFTLLADDQDERTRWRAILDKLGIEVYAESVEGFEPSKPVLKRPTKTARPKREQPTRARAGKGKPSKKSKKSRPIKKGQKPGRGVIRPQ